jgi:hypothetical protein
METATWESGHVGNGHMGNGHVGRHRQGVRLFIQSEQRVMGYIKSPEICCLSYGCP